MDLAELALLQRMQGNADEVSSLSRQALEYELAAIRELNEAVEPTFSVLHRSAGTLALQCSEFRLAEQIAAKALAEEPPPEIAEELRDLFEQANFQRHLESRGVELGHEELTISLSGSGVGYGFVDSHELLRRIGDASRLLGRIAERRIQRPFNEHGLRKSAPGEFPVHVSVPRAASFAVTLRVGQPTGQFSVPFETEAIVDEFMDLMEMVSCSDIQALEERIMEPAYLRNFLGLARRIAPDGTRVRQVVFTVDRGDRSRYVSMTKQATEFPLPPIVDLTQAREGQAKPVELRGALLFSDSTGSGYNGVKVVTENGRRRSVTVPTGMMNDIVRPMWNSRVVVKGLRVNRAIILQDIGVDEESEEELDVNFRPIQ